LKLVPATAALAAVIFGFVEGPTLWTGFQVGKAQAAIGATFADRRTTLSRLPGVGYSPHNPFPTKLGADDGLGVDEVPPSLHEASGAANKNIQAGNADPRWLQIQGRALLWESTPSSLEKAAKDFEKARSQGLATASLEIDLAASYFEIDSRNGEPPNLQRTLNLLSEVLSKPNLSKDDKASTLFNLAIAYEKTHAWDLAVETWNKYLQVDSTSGWADEARQHLKEAQKKISFLPQNYSDPSFFLQQKDQGTLRLEDPEQYQQALIKRLPSALADRNSDAYHALQGLAEVFAERQDFWWRDFLKSVQPRDQDAVQELVTATMNNENGAFGDALTHSRAAIKSFKSSGNLPGELLARYQEVYASRSMMDGKECLARAGPLIAQSGKAGFAWIHAQSLLESSQCRNFQMQFAKSDADATQSLLLSKQFPVLTIRVLGIIPGMKRQQKKYEESWTRAVEGLAAYWQRAYPTERLDQFYAVMLQDAEESHYPFLAEALLRHVIDIREHIVNRVLSNPVRKGLLHLELANLLTARQAKDEAQKEMQTASDILKTAADSSDQLRCFRRREDCGSRVAAPGRRTVTSHTQSNGRLSEAHAKQGTGAELLPPSGRRPFEIGAS
jgi:hypothetical protein